MIWGASTTAWAARRRHKSNFSLFMSAQAIEEAAQIIVRAPVAWPNGNGVNICRFGVFQSPHLLVSFGQFPESVRIDRIKREGFLEVLDRLFIAARPSMDHPQGHIDLRQFIVEPDRCCGTLFGLLRPLRV